MMTRFSKERREDRIRAMCERSDARVKMLIKAGVSAPPVGDEQEYQQVLAWRNSGDPRYWNNAQTQSRFEMLAQRFGTPPAIQQPFGVASQASPRGVGSAGSHEQQSARFNPEEPATINETIPAAVHVPGLPDE